MNKKTKLILLFMLVLAGFLLFGNTQVAKSGNPAGPTASTIDNVMELTYPQGSIFADSMCVIDQTSGECTEGTVADLTVCIGEPDATRSNCPFFVINSNGSCYWYNTFGSTGIFGGSGFGIDIFF